MLMRKYSCFLFMLALTLISIQCKRTQDDINSPTPVAPATPSDPITATLQGTVFDETGSPAANVTIRVGNTTVVTTNKGYFRILEAPLDKKMALVTAEKNGYFKAFRSFAATSGANHVEIKLIKKVSAGTIAAASGGSVTLSNGSKVELPANAVVKKGTTTAYTGDITVYASYINPVANDITQTMPGSLMADDKNGSRVTLESYGMMAVELVAANGDALQIATGKTSKLTVAIPSGLQATAPASMPLWFIDETTGIWKEEGSCSKVGNNYVGEVSHFSFWNCDIPFPAVEFKARLTDASGNPWRHVTVIINQVGTATTRGAITDSLGQVCGMVPKNVPLRLAVLNACSQSIYTQDLGSFTGNKMIDPLVVSIPPVNVLTFEGAILNCAGQATTAGSARIEYGNRIWFVSTGASGQFKLIVPDCQRWPNFTITAQDIAGLQAGPAVTLPIAANSNNANAGALTACGTSMIQYINYTIDDTAYTMNASVSNHHFSASTLYLGSVYTRPYNTNISGSSSGLVTPSTQNIVLRFWHDSTAGMLFADNFTINIPNQAGNTWGVIPPSTVAFTNYPSRVGEYYEGRFSGTIQNSFSLPRRLSVEFKVKKTN